MSSRHKENWLQRSVKRIILRPSSVTARDASSTAAAHHSSVSQERMMKEGMTDSDYYSEMEDRTAEEEDDDDDVEEEEEYGDPMSGSLSTGRQTDGNSCEIDETEMATALATQAAAAAAAAAQAAAEVVRLTQSPYYQEKRNRKHADRALSMEFEYAAIKIQSAFRGYLARKALRALKGVVKLQAVMRGNYVRSQARMALQCMQTLIRLQSRVRERQANFLSNADASSCTLEIVSESMPQANGRRNRRLWVTPSEHVRLQEH